MKNKITTIFIIVLLIITIIVYYKMDYNFFYKGVIETGKTSFSRDSKITSNGKRSYKVENKDFNDAMFYRKIKVKEFTPYKVSCMVKTENVEQNNNIQTSGAQIFLKNTEEHSDVFAGTNDWQKLEFCFNSKNNTELEIGFRLGGNGEKVKGTAWFSDISLEEGFLKDDNSWNFACFIIDNVDVKLENGQSIQTSISQTDVLNIANTMKRFKATLPLLSKNKMQVSYDAIEIKEPITTLTYDEDNGYYISEKDVYNQIKRYTQKTEYDHVFICVKLPSEQEMQQSNKVDWIGLGNMQFCGKGFSNIRIANNADGTYKFSNRNTFPEEVFIHEFLHTLERNSEEYGFTVPALHSYSDYGYKESNTDGLRTWYIDYMNKAIKTSNGNIGLDEEIYKYKPIQLSNFQFSNKLNYLDEPKGIVQNIQSITDKVINLFKKKELTLQEKGVSE